jgi:preprotein translocase subunit SecE
LVRAPDSKSGCCGFDSLLACIYFRCAETMIGKAKDFLGDVKVEVKKVTWPSRKDAMGGTMVVVVVVAIMSIFLGLVDTLLSKIVEALISS